MHYAEQGDPGGEALLFIHGWPDSWFSFSRVLPLLPAAYHAYAIDLRGFGDSERPATATRSTSSPPTWWHSWTRSASPGRP